MSVLRLSSKEKYWHTIRIGEDGVMQITGEKALANISEELIYDDTINILDDDNVNLDTLFLALDQHVSDETFMRIAGEINGGVAAGGTTLALETNVINLPLRYTNQLKKLIWPEKEDNEINLYMIVENADVSRSNLKIALASSVTTYLDDADSVKAKISQWYDEQLAHIVDVQQLAEKTEDDKTAKA
ncbi:hypothetical protein JOD28_000720 [Leuconostoc rapi]|nr:hypothetical protein [Leuconostoc rapi]